MPFKMRDKHTDPLEYDPRWKAYARAHGKTPEEAHKDDRAKHVDHMHRSFEEWIRSMWPRFDAERGIPTGPGTDIVRDDKLQQQFTAWLVEVVSRTS